MIKKKNRTVSYRRYGIPALIIEGKHLSKFGFEIGDSFDIDYQLNQILIIKSREEVICDE